MRVWLLLFQFVSPFCCLIALARTSRTILNRYGESGQPYLVPDFSGIAVSFSSFSLMLAVGLLYIAFIMFIMLRNVHCIPALSKTIIMEGCCILPKAFLAYNEMIMVSFFISLLIWFITLTDFHMLYYFCISGMKLTW